MTVYQNGALQTTETSVPLYIPKYPTLLNVYPLLWVPGTEVGDGAEWGFARVLSLTFLRVRILNYLYFMQEITIFILLSEKIGRELF